MAAAYEKECFKTGSKIRKMGNAGMWTDYSFHGEVMVGLTEKVIVESKYLEEVRENLSEVIATIVLTSSLC